MWYVGTGVSVSGKLTSVCREVHSCACADLYPYVSRSNTQFREAVPVSKRVAVCLWRLAGNSEYRTVSHLFGIGCSTACTVTNQVCRAIVQHLLKRYIRLPCRN